MPGTTTTSDLKETNRLAEAFAQDDAQIDFDRKPRIDIINLSADEVSAATAHLPQDQQALVRWLFSFAKENGWGWKETARQSGLSTTTLYRVWNDAYREPTAPGVKMADRQRISLDGVCESIARFKILAARRGEAVRGVRFVETSTWHIIRKICDEARDMQIISLIYGESQIGKTISFEEYTRRNNSGRTIYVRAPACAGVQLLLKHIATACHISPKSSFENLMHRVCKFLDHSKLLIVDEAHLFFETYQKTSVLRCLETIREIYDRTGCGLVICGTEVFREELRSGEFAKMLRQLHRRGIWEEQLDPVAPWPDVLLIAAAYGLPAPKAEAEELVKYIITHSGLGKFTKFLIKAQQVAAKHGQKLNWQHFVRVHDLIAKRANPSKH